MKNIIAALLCLCLAVICRAQSPLSHDGQRYQHDTFHKYKIDGTVGGAFPTGRQPNGTLVLTAEPHYRLSDENELGFRVQEAFLRQLNSGKIEGFSISPMDSYCFTAEHYFSNRFFRPFIGAGAGIFRQGEVINGAFPSQSILEVPHIGGFPRLGFELGVLRFSAEYNFMQNNSNGSNSGYISINAGFFMGGGGLDRR